MLQWCDIVVTRGKLREIITARENIYFEYMRNTSAFVIVYLDRLLHSLKTHTYCQHSSNSLKILLPELVSRRFDWTSQSNL